MRLRTITLAFIILVLSPFVRAQHKYEEVTVHGRVTDLYGRTLEGAMLRFYSRGFKALTEVKFVKNATTDANGNYSLDGIPSGHYVVSVELRGFVYTELGRIFLGERNNLLDIGLEVGRLTDVPPIEISGIVRSVDKTPLKDAAVTLMSASNSEILYRTRTDQYGKYKFVVYTSSQYLIYAAKPGFEVSATTTLGNAKEKNFFLTRLKN